MALSINLIKRGTTSTYSLRCADGMLTDLLAVTSGTKSINGKTWTLNKSTASGKIRITLGISGSLTGAIGIDFISDTVLPAFEIPLGHIGQDYSDFLELGEYDLIVDGQTDQYPRYYVKLTALPNSGSMSNRVLHETCFQIQNQSISGYESSDGVPKQLVYGCPLVLKNTLGDYIFGEIVTTLEQQGSAYTVPHVYIEFSSSVTSENWVAPDYDPGDKGFRPTGSRTDKNVPGTGGRGTSNKRQPDYSSQTILQPGEPDETKASAIGSGFINAYDITSANLLNVGKCLYSSTMLTMIANLFVNPLDAIISLNVFPYTPHIGSAESVRLLNHQCTTLDLGVEASGFPLTKQFRTVDFGSIHIPENWGNFLDYSDTTIELYLPFVGSIELDTSEAMNANINVQYTIDYFTGMCVANVQCTKTVVLPSALNVPATSQHSYQGNCAIQIPLSAVDYGSMVGSLVGACATGLANPAGGVMKLASDAVAGAWKPSVSTKGNIVANAGYCSVLYPYVRITRPITAEPDSYQEVMGYPSYINTTLGQCDDFCVCDDIDLHTITGATPSELARIKQYCQSGVHV